jgi:hypothetical protein
MNIFTLSRCGDRPPGRAPARSRAELAPEQSEKVPLGYPSCEAGRSKIHAICSSFIVGIKIVEINRGGKNRERREEDENS